jgi:hypothetical protein
MVREPQWRVRVTALFSDDVGVDDAATSNFFIGQHLPRVGRRLQETIHVTFCRI